MYQGNKEIKKIYLGDKEVKKIYQGDKLIYTSVVSYSITPTLTNVSASASNPSFIVSGGTATLIFTANEGYNLPDSVSVVGATSQWTKATGTLVLRNPTGDVTFSVVGESVGLTELCFTANTAGSTVELIVKGTPSIANTAYSRDRITWNTFTPSATAGTNVVTLTNVGDKVYFRNDITANLSTSYHMQFVMSGSISASGNINSMYVSTGFNDLDTLVYTNCYFYLFADCTSLTTAPELPATTLTNGCYFNMFYGCTSLTNAPELPATTLANYCYNCMFGNTSLTQAPELPATTLAYYCYQNMFYGCTSLTQAPELPATTLADNCYESMFEGCTSLQVSNAQTTDTPYAWNIPQSGLFKNDTYQMNTFTNCAGIRSLDDLFAMAGTNIRYYTQKQPV